MRANARKDIGLRLRAIRRDQRMTQAAFARVVGGCTQAFVSDVEIGRSAPGADLIAGVERLGYSGLWLLTGEGAMALPRLAGNEDTIRIEDNPVMSPFLVRDRPVGLYGLRELPLVSDVPAGLKSTTQDGEVERTVPVYLREHADCRCFVLQVKGKDMEPVFRSGDMVVIDQTCRIEDNDVVVIVEGDQAMLKRVAMDDSRVYLLNTSQAGAPICVSRDWEGVHKIGKVVQLIRESF